MILFDTHAHYDDRRFDKDRDALLASMPEQGVGYICNIGCDMPTSHQSVALAEAHDHVYAVVGIHPHSAAEATEEDYAALEQLSRHPKVLALGEMGLDYHYDFSPRDVQRQVFARQMELAGRLNLPVVIHEREACQDVLEVVRQHKVCRGVYHCYSGSAETARELVQLGYYLGFNGVITFDNARRSHEVIRNVPLERLLLETDCPYLTPVPHRGKRNDSGLMKYSLQKMAELRGSSYEEMVAATEQNAKRLFGIA
jgi:TatD DNase family protein